MEHPLARQLEPFRYQRVVDYPATLSLAGKLFTKEGDLYEIVEVYCGDSGAGNFNALAATVKHPRKADWSGAEVLFFALPELLEGLGGGPGVPPLPRDLPVR